MSDPIQLYIFCKTDHPSLLDNTPPHIFYNILHHPLTPIRDEWTYNSVH